jgi:hypothetical protein
MVMREGWTREFCNTLTNTERAIQWERKKVSQRSEKERDKMCVLFISQQGRMLVSQSRTHHNIFHKAWQESQADTHQSELHFFCSVISAMLCWRYEPVTNLSSCILSTYRLTFLLDIDGKPLLSIQIHLQQGQVCIVCTLKSNRLFFAGSCSWLILFPCQLLQSLSSEFFASSPCVYPIHRYPNNHTHAHTHKHTHTYTLIK